MSRPRLLDLFCCEGGAGMGYHRAGFDVVGVDVVKQPRYPFEFHQADALEFCRSHGHEFDAIHASPPCQAYSEATPAWARAESPDLIAATRTVLEEIGKPYIIENVENARSFLCNPVMLCGTMFGLPIWRHRYFECHPFWVMSPASCRHAGRPVTPHPGSNARKGRGAPSVAVVRRAMGIDWMSSEGLIQAIPPTYTEFLGRRLLAAVTQSQEAAA